MKRVLAYIIASLTLLACSEKIEQPKPKPDKEPSDTTASKDTSTSPSVPEWPADKRGPSYVWDDDVIPEIHITVGLKEWNTLLNEADTKLAITPYIKCSVSFMKGEDVTECKEVGLRLYDNHNAMRPEGEKEEIHNSRAPKWNFSNYELDFSKYRHSQTLRDIRKIYLTSCINDPSYVREKFAHDTFRRAGIWTIPHNSWCRLWIHVGNDEEPAYFGIYQMREPVEDGYLAARMTNLMGSTSGPIWKCSNMGAATSGAFLINTSSRFGADLGDILEYNYMLKTNLGELNQAREQLQDFMDNVRTLRGRDFTDWISEVMDVDLFLKTYALNTALGNTEDYWSTGNNYYLYFTSTASEGYKVYYIPDRFHMSLGSVSNLSRMEDSGIQDPISWGNNNAMLLSKLLSDQNHKETYLLYIHDYLADPKILKPASAKVVMKALADKISPYTKNDTGSRNTPADYPAPNTSQYLRYKLWNGGGTNFLEEKAGYIKEYLETNGLTLLTHN